MEEEKNQWALDELNESQNSSFSITDDLESLNIQNFEEIIKAFKSLDTTNQQAEQTFMQICGYPHYENVCSNLLGYFFDTGETHKFKDLFIRSLLACVVEDEYSYITENVERECGTDENNRIDIVIETESHFIAIENKIYSGVDNPLKNYETYIKGRADASGKKYICVLLSLRAEGKSIENTSFCNITYSELLDRIKGNLGLYVMEASTKWVILLNDFIKTIEGLQEGTALDKEFLDFYNNHKADINNLIEARDNLLKSVRVKWNKVKQLIRLKEDYSVEDDFDKDNCSATYSFTHTGVKQIDSKIELGVVITPRGYVLIIGIAESVDNIDEQKRKLEKFLKDNAFKNFEKWSDDESSLGWTGIESYYLLEKVSILEHEEVIAQKLQYLINIVFA